MTNTDKAKIIASATFVAISACLFVYLWKALGDNGIYADETGASGAITTYEYTLVFLMFTSIIVSRRLFLRVKGNSAAKEKFRLLVFLIICFASVVCILISISTR